MWLRGLSLIMPRARFRLRIRCIDPNQSTAASAPAQGTAPVESGLETRGQGEEAREAFLQIMICTRKPKCKPPPPPPIPQPVPVAPQGVDLVRITKPPVDKIRKQRAEEFRANIDDDPERAEF
ncbi:Chaperone surA [Gossypium australe]|uniref:Chaperone surA n=1 Tax=Gossypium australe TaxID=47621 RepID=A0A5B6X141_9ROSI|nr:Chaperone surA [Gossypium australe]